MAVSVTFTAPDLEELLAQMGGFIRTARGAPAPERRPEPMPLADPPPNRPGPSCPDHLKELILKVPGPTNTWAAGYYCPERGCRTFRAAAS